MLICHYVNIMSLWLERFGRLVLTISIPTSLLHQWLLVVLPLSTFLVISALLLSAMRLPSSSPCGLKKSSDGSHIDNGSNEAFDAPSPPRLNENNVATCGTMTFFAEPSVHALYPSLLHINQHVIIL